MAVPRANNGKTWLLYKVGEFDNEMYKHYIILNHNQWCAKRINPTRKRFEAGMPPLPIPFILCAEAFSNLMGLVERKQLVRGVKFGKDVTISHLLFADDSLIFSRASIADCKNLKEIFDCYAQASGQIFNFDKSSILFSGRTPKGKITAIRGLFNLKVVSSHEKYLGLSSMIGRKKHNFFNEVKQPSLEDSYMTKVSNKRKSWSLEKEKTSSLLHSRHWELIRCCKFVFLGKSLLLIS